MTDIKTDMIIYQLQQYLFSVLNVQVSIVPLGKEEQKILPFYLKQGYQFFVGKKLFNNCLMQHDDLMHPGRETSVEG